MAILPSKPLYPIRVTKQLWEVPVKRRRTTEEEVERYTGNTKSEPTKRPKLSQTAQANHKTLARLFGHSTSKPGTDKCQQLGDTSRIWVGVYSDHMDMRYDVASELHRLQGIYAQVSDFGTVSFRAAATTIYSKAISGPSEISVMVPGEITYIGGISWQGRFKGKKMGVIKRMVIAAAKKRPGWVDPRIKRDEFRRAMDPDYL